VEATRSGENVAVKGNHVARKPRKLPVFRKLAVREWDVKVALKFALAGAGSYAFSNRASFRGNKQWKGAKNRDLEEHRRSRGKSKAFYLFYKKT